MLVENFAPKWWLSAHSHVKFLCKYRVYKENGTEKVVNFVAMDKTVRLNQFSHFFKFDNRSPKSGDEEYKQDVNQDQPYNDIKLFRDKEWCSILEHTFGYTPFDKHINRE